MATLLGRTGRRWGSAITNSMSPLCGLANRSNGGSCTRPLSSLAAETETRSAEASLPQIPPFDYTPQPYNGPSAEEVLAKRKQFLNPALFYYYKKPVRISYIYFALSVYNLHTSPSIGCSVLYFVLN
jgi:hypothetical protein